MAEIKTEKREYFSCLLNVSYLKSFEKTSTLNHPETSQEYLFNYFHYESNSVTFISCKPKNGKQILTQTAKNVKKIIIMIPVSINKNDITLIRSFHSIIICFSTYCTL